jgi:hypothetical protein
VTWWDLVEIALSFASAPVTILVLACLEWWIERSRPM